MIHELRTYTLQPGTQPAFLAHASEVGLRIRGERHGVLEGYWTSEFGSLNQVFHLWRFPGLEERGRLLAELGRNESWTKDYLPKARSMILTQESTILSPALEVAPPRSTPNVYELRRYATHPGKAPAWLDLFKAVAPARGKLSAIVGAWSAEFGALNQVVHLWAYKDLNERAAIRDRARSDPAWAEFVGKVPPLLTRMESTVLVPAGFSPLK